MGEHKSKKQVTRRTFLKGSLALGAAVSLFGCTKPKDEKAADNVSESVVSESSYSYTPALTSNRAAGTVDGDIFWGATPHNCGGENCVLKAFVKDGAIKRIVTDERVEKEMDKGDNPQDRACPRCRSRKSTIYYSNRLKYPLIQTGTRGDLTKFKKATWKEVTEYYKTKMAKVKANCGNGSVYGLYASGSGGTLGVDGKAVAGIGTYLTHDGGVTHGFEGFDTGLHSAFGPIQDYSWPAWEHVTPIIQGYYAYAQAHDAASNSYSDAVNANVIVVWGHNMSETQWTPQISYYLAQLKDKNPNAKIYLIDGRYSQTAALMESHPNFTYVGIANGTDAALIMGMVHYILTNPEANAKLKGLYGLSKDASAADLRKAIGKYLFGFFDTDDADGADVNSSYQNTAAAPFNTLTNDVLKVQPGTSWSAYIFGKSNKLVEQGYNKAASIYPDQIGYNVRNYKLADYDYKTKSWSEAKDDELAGKHTFCYGQVEKNTEWASKVTGIDKELIEQLANDFLNEKVTVWSGSGFQRCTESEEIVRSWICFNTLVRNYGQEGTSYGSVGKKGGKPAGFGARATGAPKKVVDNYSTDKGTYILTDPAKGGYNRKGLNVVTQGAETLGARANFNFCTVDPSVGKLHTSYNMEAWGTTPNVTPCFTWLENVEASLQAPVMVDKVVYEDGKFAVKQKKVRPARWNTGSNQTVSTPVGWITQMSGNQVAVTAGNSNLHAAIYQLKDNDKENMLDFITVCDNVMTPSCRFADIVLPGSMGFERYTVAGNSWGGGRNYVFTGKAINPPGEALCELEIGLILAQATGDEGGKKYANGIDTQGITADNVVANRGKFEEAFWKASYDAAEVKPKNASGQTMGWDEAKKGFVVKSKDPLTDKNGYDKNSEFTNGLGTSYDEKGVNTFYAKFRQDPKANKVNTYTGRIEAYSLRYMEDYEARYFTNEDNTEYSSIYTLADDGITIKPGSRGKINNGALLNGGSLYTKSTSAVNNNGTPAVTAASNKPRYVYPVPMYIPLIEGRHADNSHPFGKTYGKADYDLTLNTWHIMYRSHSTHNSSGFLNELKYSKRDAQGNAAHFGKTIETAETNPANPLDDGVYETCWINPVTAEDKSISEGDLVVIENDRGAIVASAHVSNRVSPGAVYIGHGSWYNPVESWTSPSGKNYKNIDVGGCANTLTNTRPSRMAQGMTLANDCRVKISKA